MVMFRGQQIDVDKKNKIVRIKILKPIGRAFSISDKIKALVDKKYLCIADVAGKEVHIDKAVPYIRREEVKSKFRDSDPWHRYWYTINDNRQMSLFSQ